MSLRTYIVSCFAAFLCLVSCSISYKLSGASIDYTKVKSISIADISNQATLVYPPLSQEITEEIKDNFIKQTKLKILQRGGQLNVEGEIIGYELTPMSTQSDGYASETKLTMTVNVRYTNSTKPDDDYEERFTAFRTFESSKMLDDVQETLCEEMVKEIAEQVFNKALAKW